LGKVGKVLGKSGAVLNLEFQKKSKSKVNKEQKGILRVKKDFLGTIPINPKKMFFRGF
jgi:hypothetical protein